MHEKGELAQIGCADPFEVVHVALAPLLVLLLCQDACLHQHIHRGRVAALTYLISYRSMDLFGQFLVVHSYSIYLLASVSARKLRKSSFLANKQKTILP